MKERDKEHKYIKIRRKKKDVRKKETYKDIKVKQRSRGRFNNKKKLIS